MTTLKKFRWIWGWDDEKEETWLREMAGRGWHLGAGSFPPYYVFEQGEPRDVVYRIDYRTTRKDKAHYLQLFRDAGWEHLMEHLGWQYFRQTATDGASPEIFSDNESKVQKYERLLMLLVVLLPLYIPFVLLDSSRLWVALTATAFMILYVGFVAFAFTSLMMRIKQLKKRL
jgi:hypothetical protein